MNTRASQRILATLHERGPLSAAEIAQYAFIAETTLSGGGYIKRLKNNGALHICGWRKSSNGFSTPLYKAGAGVDLPKPKFKNADRDSLGMAKIIAALKQHGAMSYRQIALASGLSANTIKNARYMDILLEQKRVHISSWLRNKNGPMSALYAAGRGINAPRPAVLSNAEKLRRRRSHAPLPSQVPSLFEQLRSA